MEVHKIQVKDKQIKISGDFLSYVSEEIKPSRKVQITISGTFHQSPQELLSDIRNKVFVTNPDELSSIVPKQWQDVLLGFDPLKKGPGGIAGVASDGGVIYRVGPGTSAPKAIYSPDPEYSEEARKAKYQGVVILGVIIGLDGHVSEIHIARPVGHGLDEKAIEAVRHWKFEPAIRDGKPVAVMVNIEVSFNLY